MNYSSEWDSCMHAKSHLAFFYFHGAALQFIPSELAQQGQQIKYQFSNNPSVKDAIEAIGPPHTEILAIVINERPVNFTYLLQNQDVVIVYSYDTKPKIHKKYFLPNRPKEKPKFILDVHLGGLVRFLRFAGFDT